MILMEKHNHRVVFSFMCKNNMLKLILCTFAEAYRRNRQTPWGGCTDANPKLLLNDT